MELHQKTKAAVGLHGGLRSLRELADRARGTYPKAIYCPLRRFQHDGWRARPISRDRPQDNFDTKVGRDDR